MPTTVNSRSVPTAADIKDTNENQEWENLESLLTELANVLDGTADSGNLSADDITGENLLQSGTSGTVTIDGLLTSTTTTASSLGALMTVATVGTTAVAGFLNVSVEGSSYEIPFYAKA